MLLFLPLLFLFGGLFGELFYQGGMSASAMGTAFVAGPAAAEDTSYQFYNPAAPGYLFENQVALSGRYLFPAESFAGGSAKNILLEDLTGATDLSDLSQSSVGGSFFATYCYTPTIRFNMAISTPWQMHLRMPRDWVGRYFGTRAQFESVNITPSLTYRLHNWLSIGAGVQFQYLSFQYDRAIDFGLIANELGIGGAIPSGQDGFSSYLAHNWNVGFTVGLIIQACPTVQLGLSLRSEVTHPLESFPRYEYGEIGSSVATATGAYNDLISSDITWKTPRIALAGIYWEYCPEVHLVGSFGWKEWGINKDFEFRYNNYGQPDNKTALGWKTSMSWGLGMIIDPRPTWNLRIGMQYEQSPVNQPLPLFFANEQLLFGVGWGWWIKECVRLDLGYVHTYTKAMRVERQELTSSKGEFGYLNGTLRSSGNQVALSLTAQF